MRRAQAHLYERVVRGDDDIELLFQKYKDLLDMQITVGMYFCKSMCMHLYIYIYVSKKRS